MRTASVFDRPDVKRFDKARQDLLRDLLATLRNQVRLETAADIGCGVGEFSAFLRDLGFQVVAVDGRGENVEEARKRFPDIEFRLFNAEDESLQQLGVFDLVLCVGLLYHLENPFRAIRNLHDLTGNLALVEGMSAPTSRPVMELQDEGSVENESLNRVAFYPSESCLVKMFYRAGFSYVYRFSRLPDHELYIDTLCRKRARTILAVSRVPLRSSYLQLAQEPMNWAASFDLWRRWPRLSDFWHKWSKLDDPCHPVRKFFQRLTNFLRKPWDEKIYSLRRQWTRIFGSY